MQRLALTLLVGVLTLSASGISSLVINEPCTVYEFGSDDGACPPTCVTCGCCARAVEPVLVIVATAPDSRVGDITPFLSRIPKTDPHDILHVPKSRLA